MPVVFLALGSNLGDREQNIQKAVHLLKESNFLIEKISSIIETEPIGYLTQTKFLNAVLKGSTQLSAIDLLSLTQSIEKKMGRQKTFMNGPRIIDIDILLYGREKITTPSLTIPHPRMWERDFVLKPLQEIAPEITLGQFGSSRLIA